jgi:hypothetical protein
VCCSASSIYEVLVASYLSPSFALPVVVFLRLGAGMRHSIEKAVQFVHGMPKEAASQRTCSIVMRRVDHAAVCLSDYSPSWHGML